MNALLLFVISFSFLLRVNCTQGAATRHETTLTDRGTRATELHTARFAADGDQDVDLPVPDVRHFKVAGSGYTRESPLYAKQEEMRDIGGLPIAPRPMPDSVPEVSVTMTCITNLVTLFFVVYTIHYLVLTVKHWSLVNFGEHEENHLAGYVDTLFFAPMLCILFLAAHMRAVYLTKGDPERHGLPQWWVIWAMMLCTYSLLAQTVLAVLYSVITGQPWKDATERTKRGPGESILAVCRYVVMVGIYGGFSVICVGVCVMEAPHEVWGGRDPPMSPAVLCTVFLSVLFFAVYLVLAVARAVVDTVSRRRFDTAQEQHREVETTVAFAPMLCVLFISARVRALQLDPEHGQHQPWVSYFMYACTLTVFLQTLIAVLGIILGLQVSDASRTDPPVRIIRGARDVAFLIIYICICAVMISVLLLGRDAGKPVPSVPPSVKCTMFLTTLYFFVYFAQMAARAALGLSRDDAEPPKGVLYRIGGFFRNEAKDAADIAPMLCVLFVVAFIRATQLTGGKGAPPSWAQNFMYVATWSVLFQILSRADALFENPPKTTRRACVMLQCLWLLLMCSSVLSVIIALFTMSPQDANGDGAISMLQPAGL